MALIKCPECGKEVSSKAERCIHCGYPIEKMRYYSKGVLEKPISNEKKEELLKELAKGNTNSLHNFYCARSLSTEELLDKKNTFREGYIYIFKYENGDLYLLVYTIKSTGTDRPGPSYSNKYKVWISDTGTIMANNKPLTIHNIAFKIKDVGINDNSNTIDKIIMPTLNFSKGPVYGLENEGIPKEGCYIATAVYGSYDCPQVWVLRQFRDNTLAKTRIGRAFIKTYYTISPTLVKWFGNTTLFQKMWKQVLDKIIAKLKK